MKNATGRSLIVLFTIIVIASLSLAQSTPAADPEQEMNSRLSRAMGVSLDKVVMHFYLVKAGGVVEIVAKDPEDSATAAAIQKYLQTQKELWEKGKDTVAEVHSKAPDSVTQMRKLRNEITFYMAKSDTGAVLRMFSINDQARSAIQDYLKFEIAEHKTGDSPTIDQ